MRSRSVCAIITDRTCVRFEVVYKLRGRLLVFVVAVLYKSLKRVVCWWKEVWKWLSHSNGLSSWSDLYR